MIQHRHQHSTQPYHFPSNSLDYEQCRPEFVDQMSFEFTQIKQGKLHDTLLLSSMTQNIPFSKFLTIARQRNKSFPKLAALADKQFELEGYGMLNLAGLLIGNNLALASVRSAAECMKVLRQIEHEYKDMPEMEPFIKLARQMVQYYADDMLNRFRNIQNNLLR